MSKNVRTINPDLERFMAQRMNAKTIELDASHLSIVSKAREVADDELGAIAARLRSLPVDAVPKPDHRAQDFLGPT